MKKQGFFWLLFVWTISFFPLRAQNAALGQKVPEIRAEAWLDRVRPAPAPLTVLTFFTVSNPVCEQTLEHLHALTDKEDSRLRVIIITRDDEAKIAPIMAPYLSPRMVVAFDADGKIFKSLGVNYAPFSLLVDARNRMLWQGNPLRLTEKIVSTAQ